MVTVQSGCTHQDRARSGTTKGTDENGGLGRPLWKSRASDSRSRVNVFEYANGDVNDDIRSVRREPLSAFVCHEDKVERRPEESGQPCLPHQSPLPGSASSKCTYVTDPAASGLYNSFTSLFKDDCCDIKRLLSEKKTTKKTN